VPGPRGGVRVAAGDGAGVDAGPAPPPALSEAPASPPLFDPPASACSCWSSADGLRGDPVCWTPPLPERDPLAAPDAAGDSGVRMPDMREEVLGDCKAGGPCNNREAYRGISCCV
jgi:hypothetical protein